MNNSWPTRPLSELVVGGELSYGIVQPGGNVVGGVPIVRVKDLHGGRIDTHDSLCVEPDVSDRHCRTVLSGGELLVSIVGTVGETAVAPADIAGWNVARAIAVIRLKDVAAQWVQLCLQSVDVKDVMMAALNTTVQATLNLSDLKRLRIPVPPKPVRDGIVHVLGALDDKIAANDQVRRLADKLLAATFARLAKGAGWSQLSAVGFVNQRVLKSQAVGSIRYVDISSVARGSYEFPDQMPWSEAPGRARRGLKPGDTVWSTVRPNRRSHALVLDDDEDLVASTGLAVLTPKAGRVASLYEATRTEEFVAYLESVAEGSAYPAVRGDRFASAPVPNLSPQQWDQFECIALPLRKRAHSAEYETRALARVRDELLPLLMSGKVRVKDAEDAVSEVL